ncbi:MAG: 50S ribosomal protein L18 [Blastocatellia bacterium]|nr:50S ribosomal protein L18 [Blastocatellia bacterium]MBL8192994.1 50S ribosomal protein L18 [Blastocatellia bacterium]MBN8723235.1 50S ribosomal protein L18 [Acidobacteriota bacterium]
MITMKSRAKVRQAVHKRIRKKVVGTTQRPRLCVFRSLNHIYAQVVDDLTGSTICSASTLEKDYKEKAGGNIEAAKYVGQLIAKRAIDKGIQKVVFDRGGYLYHGRIKSLAEAAREIGLSF